MAVVAAVSASTVGRIWRGTVSKPHRVKTFKLSNDRHFAEKLEDLVSLYLHALDNAIILAVDEKCQIQALDRTQPGLPWKKGRCGTMTHVYKRHGTTTPFAAMHTPDGSVIDVCMPTHNRGDWIRFRKLIDRRTPSDKQLHLIMDNHSAHQAPEVQQWLARHQRFHVHWVPTSSSCLNMVELFFRDLTVERIRRRERHRVATGHPQYIDQHYRQPKPYLWTAKARDILEKVKRAWMKLRAGGSVPKERELRRPGQHRPPPGRRGPTSS